MPDNSGNSNYYELMPFVDNINAPDIFANEAVFYSLSQSVISLTLVSHRLDLTALDGLALGAGAKPSRVVIGRLVMPIESARLLSDSLSHWIALHDAPSAISKDTKQSN